ncbi:hypothetical protein APHAL10511_000465 [Amanita phalloides]|nr:hypothetical protein APHAL10511_000465 [Amanita phalloides]
MKTHVPHTRNPVQIHPQAEHCLGDVTPPELEEHLSDDEDNIFGNQIPFDQTDDWQDPPPAHIKTKTAEDMCVHPHINGCPCNPTGTFLQAGSPPLPWNDAARNDFAPYASRGSYKLTDLLFHQNKLPANQINNLM